ncbi:MAG: amidohydrolase family protein, partial [Ktedonobacterales bacterium]|nr:amidohydrolase family protein [Ktedonobacterales bacterium]
GWLDATSAPGDPLPSELAKRFYVDTATATPAALALAVAALGSDHVLYGSDWPLSATAHPGDPATDPITMVEKLAVGPAGRAAILADNAQRLFGE